MDRVNFLIVEFYTITCNFVTMKCYFFQSDFFLFIIQYNILFFASGIQLTKFHLVIALSLFVGLTTPGDDNVIGDGKRTIQITNYPTAATMLIVMVVYLQETLDNCFRQK
jgi:hypothetical protein